MLFTILPALSLTNILDGSSYLQVTDLIDKLQKHATVCIGQLNFTYYSISLSAVHTNLPILIS